MTQAEVDAMTLFMGKNVAFIGKMKKDGTISKSRKKLSQAEIYNFILWFIQDNMSRMEVDEFTLNVNNLPTYKISKVKEENNNG